MTQEAQTNQPADTASVHDVARHLYESSPMTFDQVAAEIGRTSRSVKRWSATDGGWTKLSGPEITARAQAAANKITAATAHADEAARPAITAELRIEAAVDERAAVLSRHRSEWGILRSLIGEAVSSRDGARAKLAVDIGRALELTQKGECRAWGIIDAGDAERGNTVVVIERG